MMTPWIWPPIVILPSPPTPPSGGGTGGGAPDGTFATDDAAGIDAIPGPQGERGPVGATGAAGPPADTFAVDDVPDLTPGPQGERGPVGATGAQGVAGPPADTFAVDDAPDLTPGPQGERGPVGATGAAGPPADTFAVDDVPDLIGGPQGQTGSVGPCGPAGPPTDVYRVDDNGEIGVGSFGSSQQSQAPQGGPSPVQAATSAYSVPNNTLSTIPGVSFPLLPNKTYVYYFDGEMSSNNALGATINFASTFSGSSSRFLQAGILGSGNGTFDNPVSNTNGGELTASVAALTTGNWPFRIHGQIDTTSAGNLTLQVRRNNATVNVQLQGWVRQAN